MCYCCFLNINIPFFKKLFWFQNVFFVLKLSIYKDNFFGPISHVLNYSFRGYVLCLFLLFLLSQNLIRVVYRLLVCEWERQKNEKSEKTRKSAKNTFRSHIKSPILALNNTPYTVIIKAAILHETEYKSSRSKNKMSKW